MMKFIESCQITVKSGYTILHLQQQYLRVSSCSASLPAIIIVNIFYFSHSNKCVVVSPCGFSLHFSNGSWYWTFFHVFICHSYILFGEMSVQTFCLFFNGCLFSYCWILNSSYILDAVPLLNMWFANIFSSLYLIFLFSQQYVS